MRQRHRDYDPLLLKAVFALIATIVALLELYASSHVFHSILIGLGVGALLIVGEIIFEIRRHQQHNKKSRYEFILKNRGNLIGDLFLELDGELETALDHEDGGAQFVVEHQQLAIHSYAMFWRLLVQRQKPGSDSKLTVKTVHSCDMDIWTKHFLAPSLLQVQEQFCKRGGNIERILCAKGESPDAQVCQAAENMLKAGVKVRYYNVEDTKISDHNFSWDFAVVVQTLEAVVWDSFSRAPLSPIDKAVYLRHGKYHDRNLVELWEQIDAASTDYVPHARETSAPVSIGVRRPTSPTDRVS